MAGAVKIEDLAMRLLFLSSWGLRPMRMLALLVQQVASSKQDSPLRMSFSASATPFVAARTLLMLDWHFEMPGSFNGKFYKIVAMYVFKQFIQYVLHQVCCALWMFVLIHFLMLPHLHCVLRCFVPCRAL